MNYMLLKCLNRRVSRLCFGTLTIGPVQRNLPVLEGAALLKRAVDLGVNFFDTADCYENYEYILKGLRGEDVVIATKSYAYDRTTAKHTLERYLRETKRERAEIFLLHEQESAYTLKGHEEAIEYFLEKKREGLIGAFGISTHFVAGVKAAAYYPEIDVIHPLINMSGLGIADGNAVQMIQAISTAASAGKDIYAMKPLGGGHLIQQSSEAFDFLLRNEIFCSIAVGMQSIEEVEYNCAYFSGEKDAQAGQKLKNKRRELLIQDWCKGCGSCIERCTAGALHLENGRAVCDQDRCVFCGYCARACKEFAIKVI